jgi:hypothetical protein
MGAAVILGLVLSVLIFPFVLSLPKDGRKDAVG